MDSIVWKFPGRRKAEEFTVYKEQDGKVVIQSNKTIAQINMETHKGILNADGQEEKYFLHLSFGKPYKFPVELIDLLERKKPRTGDMIGESEVTGPIFWS